MNNSNDVSVVLTGLNVKFPIANKPIKRAVLDWFSSKSSGAGASSFHALKDIDLTLRRGDRLALLGKNGAGKTTLLRALAGVYEPFSGNIVSCGRVTSLISVTAGLEMHLSGRENIYIKGSHMGLSYTMIKSIEQDILDFASIGSFIDLPIKKYSSGMLVRLAFAISTSFPIEILLLDEWLSAGDKDFAKKSEERMHRMIGNSSIMVLASHSMTHLETWCNKAAILSDGSLSELYDDVTEAIKDYENS